MRGPLGTVVGLILVSSLACGGQPPAPSSPAPSPAAPAPAPAPVEDVICCYFEEPVEAVEWLTVQVCQDRGGEHVSESVCHGGG